MKSFFFGVQRNQKFFFGVQRNEKFFLVFSKRTLKVFFFLKKMFRKMFFEQKNNKSFFVQRPFFENFFSKKKTFQCSKLNKQFTPFFFGFNFFFSSNFTMWTKSKKFKNSNRLIFFPFLFWHTYRWFFANLCGDMFMLLVFEICCAFRAFLFF